MKASVLLTFRIGYRLRHEKNYLWQHLDKSHFSKPMLCQTIALVSHRNNFIEFFNWRYDIYTHTHPPHMLLQVGRFNVTTNEHWVKIKYRSRNISSNFSHRSNNYCWILRRKKRESFFWCDKVPQESVCCKDLDRDLAANCPILSWY